MHDSELTLVFRPEMDEEEGLPAALDKVTELIVQKGGAVSDVARWGKRKLAYPIAKFMEGYYVLARVQLGPTWIGELEADLELSEDVLRYLVVRAE